MLIMIPFGAHSILYIHMLLLRLCYSQTSNLFPPGLWCQPAYSPPPVSLCSIEPQTTSLPTQSGWPGAWSASPPTGRTSPYHSLSRPFQSDPSPRPRLGLSPFLQWAVQNPPYSHQQRLRKGCWGNSGGCLEVKKLKLWVRVVLPLAEMAGPLYRCLARSLNVGCVRKGTILNKAGLCSCGRLWRSWQLEVVCWLTPCSQAATLSLKGNLVSAPPCLGKSPMPFNRWINNMWYTNTTENYSAKE